MTSASGLAALGDEKFLSLTTFRKSGDPVPTAVWVARDGAALVVTTPAGSGKVKRLRNESRVELRPCSRSGKVTGAGAAAGTAEIISDPGAQQAPMAELARKYGLQFKLVMFLERRFRGGRNTRVILRITEA